MPYWTCCNGFEGPPEELPVAPHWFASPFLGPVANSAAAALAAPTLSQFGSWPTHRDVVEGSCFLQEVAQDSPALFHQLL